MYNNPFSIVPIVKDHFNKNTGKGESAEQRIIQLVAFTLVTDRF
jgi:hypothetical protein